MKRNFGILTAIIFVMIASFIGCSETDIANPMITGTSDEESANQLTLDETYDNVRNGARLIMKYDAATNSFNGTVENTTSAVLQQVRVEIHLFDSKTGNSTAELGPTTPKDLAPGETQDIVLMAEGPSFDMWTAHPEVGGSSAEGGGSEHGPGGEGAETGGEGNTEGGEGSGEHDQGGHN